MSLIDEVKPYICLSFDEANILIQNFRKRDFGGIIARLDNLISHTEDVYLQKELQSLLQKLRELTPEEYAKLAYDIEAGVLVFPPNYVLPHIE